MAGRFYFSSIVSADLSRPMGFERIVSGNQLIALPRLVMTTFLHHCYKNAHKIEARELGLNKNKA